MRILRLLHILGKFNHFEATSVSHRCSKVTHCNENCVLVPILHRTTNFLCLDCCWAPSVSRSIILAKSIQRYDISHLGEVLSFTQSIEQFRIQRYRILALDSSLIQGSIIDTSSAQQTTLILMNIWGRWT